MTFRFAAAALAAGLFAAGAASAQDAGAAASLPNPFAARPAAPPPPVVAADARSEPTLRAIIGGLGGGDLDYSLLSDELATAIRGQAATVAPLIQSFGPIEDVAFVGRENGADLFSIRFAAADTQWIIGFNADGKVGALLFRPAPE